MFRNDFRPGDPVPQDEFFWVHHYRHRLPHVCRTLFQFFPACQICGDRVRFELAPHVSEAATDFLRNDSDFKHAIGVIPLKNAATSGCSDLEH